MLKLCNVPSQKARKNMMILGKLFLSKKEERKSAKKNEEFYSVANFFYFIENDHKYTKKLHFSRKKKVISSSKMGIIWNLLHCQNI